MKKINSGKTLLVIVLLLGYLFVFADTERLAQCKNISVRNLQASQATTADQLLKLGLFYHNNDDISDKAATQFRSVIAKYPASNEAETAQFFLGAYYQRKYYVQMAQYGNEDKGALDAAVREFRAYTDKFYKGGSHQWLGDAFFNLALVYLKKGDRQNAGYELNKMRGASSLDGSVYIYQIVYSQKDEDIINGTVTTDRLARYTSSLINDSTKSFEQITAAIRNWYYSGSKG